MDTQTTTPTLSTATRTAITIAATLAFSSSALILTACSTTKGLGEDIEYAGDAISDTADDAMD